MKSIKMDFVRDGGPTDILRTGRTYHVVIDSSRHRQFDMPVDQAWFLDRLAELRYHESMSEKKRETALGKLSRAVTKVLEPPQAPRGSAMVQLDVVTEARELWALPLEAALTPDGKPMLVVRKPAVVLTRRLPQEFAEFKRNWPVRPRILFAYASPNWVEGHTVQASEHKDALLKAIQPWIEPLPNSPTLFGREESVLTTLKDASIEDIAKALRTAETEKKPYTHIHLLAHGVKMEDAVYSHRARYGIALRSKAQRATTPEALAATLRPRVKTGGSGPEMPIVVTLAICDGGNATNTIIEAGGVAQELHRAGVPIVIASQLPLTFPGSEIVTREFYDGWMAGDDVRAVLHATRVALYEDKHAAHDWVSLVAYVRLPEGYNEYLFAFRLRSQLAALEITSKYAGHLLDNNITDSGQYDLVADRLLQLVRRLEHPLDPQDETGSVPKTAIVQEKAGLLGSAYKRLAELLAWRANAQPTHRKRWLAESRSTLAKARDAYRSGFQCNPAHHWSGVQYLALDTVLNGCVSDVAAWYACDVAAKAQRDNPGSSTTERVWALGSIAELVLLARLAKGVDVPASDAVSALKDLCASEKAAPPGTFDVSPILSTHRQLMRYVHWWTKNNGYFSARDADLVKEARKLVRLLE